MRNKFVNALLLASTGLCFVSTPSFAQQDTAATTEQNSGSGSDIVVTARRSEERLQDVPISITVFNQAQISERNIVTANDLTTYTPSLTSSPRYGDETATFAIRGFTQDNFTSPSVAVYFADVVAPRAQGGTSGGNGAGVGSFFDLQNVQVLKGPQGTLFGRNTTGGAILLVPQKPTSKLEGYLEGSYGNYDMKRVQGVVNVPLSDSARLRVGIDYQNRDGYIKNKSGIGPSDFNDTNYLAARASLVVDVTPNLENYTILTYSRSNTHGTVGRIAVSQTATSPTGVPCQPTTGGLAGLLGPLACAQIARANARGDGYYDVENSNPDAHLRLKQFQAINTTTWQASDAITIKNIASYSQFTQGQSSSLFADNFNFFGMPLDYVGLYQDPGRHNIQQYSATDELQLQGRTSDGNLTYQVGAYYERSGPLHGYQGSLSDIFLSCTNVLTKTCTNPLGFGFIQNSLTKYSFTDIGFYGQATYRFTDKLSLTAGIRYTIDKVRATGATRTYVFQPFTSAYSVVCPNNPLATGAANDPNVCARTASTKSEKPTWLIDLDYKPDEDLLLYGKYSRGYRQASLNVSNTVPNAWGPEKVDNYEIGAKKTFRGPVEGYLDIAGFHAELANQQLIASLVPDGSNPLASPAATIINGGKSRIQGIDVDAQISPLRGLRLNAGYAYLDTKLKSVSFAIIQGYLPVAPNSAPGGDLTLAPHHKLTTSINYTLPLDESIGRVSVGATYTYTARQLVITTSPLGVLPATNLVNLNASWTGIGGSPVDLSLFVTNLMKRKYSVYVGQSYNSTGFDSLILGQPRLAGVRLRVRFGN